MLFKKLGNGSIKVDSHEMENNAFTAIQLFHKLKERGVGGCAIERVEKNLTTRQKPVPDNLHLSDHSKVVHDHPPCA
jgi:hypothetical protein